MVSLATAFFGLTEPLFVPEYWNPPTLFDLAQRTGFDLESLIFCFGIGVSVPCCIPLSRITATFQCRSQKNTSLCIAITTRRSFHPS